MQNKFIKHYYKIIVILFFLTTQISIAVPIASMVEDFTENSSSSFSLFKKLDDKLYFYTDGFQYRAPLRRIEESTGDISIVDKPIRDYDWLFVGVNSIYLRDYTVGTTKDGTTIFDFHWECLDSTGFGSCASAYTSSHRLHCNDFNGFNDCFYVPTATIEPDFFAEIKKDPSFGEYGYINGLSYYSKYDDIHGHELWQSTEVGDNPSFLIDIYPGIESGGPRDFTKFGDKLYFSANDEVHGRELWLIEETDQYPKLVDLNLGAGGSDPSEFTKIGDKLYFAANDGIHGRELWVIDKTDQLPRLLMDIVPGLSGSDPFGFTEVGNKVYFSANDETHGKELWVMDQDIELFKDINPGFAGGDPENLTQLGDKLYFTANDGIHGRELWVVKDSIGVSPTANDDEYSLNANKTLFVSSPGILKNDTDLGLGNLNVVLISDVSNGSLNLSENGSFSYEPVSGFHGVDFFIYQVTDGNFNSETAKVELMIKNTGSEIEQGDFDSDNDIDKDDLVLMKKQFGKNANSSNVVYDVNNDGIINVLDFRQAIKLCTRPRCASF